MIEEERWQQTYLKEVFQQNIELKSVYTDIIAKTASIAAMVDDTRRSSDKLFMNEIKSSDLAVNFFSEVEIGNTSGEWRREDYNRWKR